MSSASDQDEAGHYAAAEPFTKVLDMERATVREPARAEVIWVSRWRRRRCTRVGRLASFHSGGVYSGPAGDEAGVGE
jgi:hypothetical protein